MPSRTTLQSPIVLDCCRYFAALMLEALAGAPKAELLAHVRQQNSDPQIDGILLQLPLPNQIDEP